MTKVINREICPHCFQTINNRQFTMFKDLAVALYDVWQWCIRNNRSTDIKRSEIKHLFKTENVSGRFGDLKYLMEECVGGKKKGYYDFDLRKIGLFFSGKLSIPTEIIKNGKSNELTLLKYRTIHDIPKISEFLTEKQDFIVRYFDKDSNLQLDLSI